MNTILPKFFIPTIAVITVLAPFAIDVSLPSLPFIAIYLSTSDKLAQYTITVFLLGFALGPLIFGPISDALGRRKLINVSLLSFSIFSLLCAISENIIILLIFRFLQAVSGSIATVCGRACIADLLSGNELAKQLSIIGVLLNLAPILAPIFGAWVILYFEWQFTYYFMCICGFLFLIQSIIFIPETLKLENRITLDFLNVFQSFKLILSNKVAMLFILYLSSSSAVFFAFLTSSPYIYIEKFSISPLAYSYIFGAGACITLLSNLLVYWFLKYINYRSIITLISFLMIFNSIILILGGFQILGKWAIYAPGLTFMALFHIANVTGLTGLLDLYKKKLKGTASALAISFRFTFGMIGSLLVTLFFNSTMWPYIIVVMIFTLITSSSGFFSLYLSKNST